MWPFQAALSELLKDFADIAEIGGVESFSETRVDAFQIGDGGSFAFAPEIVERDVRINPVEAPEPVGGERAMSVNAEGLNALDDLTKGRAAHDWSPAA